MRIETKRRDAEGENGNPEVDEVRRPQCQCNIEQHDQGSHCHVDAWASEPRKENVEVDLCGRKATTGRNVPSPSKSQIAQNQVGVDLSREDLEDRQERAELLGQAENGLPCPTFDKFCEK